MFDCWRVFEEIHPSYGEKWVAKDEGAGMAVVMGSKLRRLTQAEFGSVAFEVMRDVFAIHEEFGRFFDEKIYKRELARRRPDVRMEVPVDILFESFRKRYFLDFVAGEGGLFEFKATEASTPRDRAQLTHYLHLCDLAHGKLVNMRPGQVEHEFVNTALTCSERLSFELSAERWSRDLSGASRVEEVLVPLLRDWGVGLELPLYEEALTHFLGGEAAVNHDVEVLGNGASLGVQRLRLAAPRVAFKVTAFSEHLDAFEAHARRFLQHTALDGILWINIARDRVTLTSIR
jgi:GxxExxY protein